jgi:hypothetical protein
VKSGKTWGNGAIQSPLFFLISYFLKILFDSYFNCHYLYGIILTIVLQMSIFHQFIKPTSKFDELQFIGDATLQSQDANACVLILDELEFKVTRWNWEDAFKNKEWIKLGRLCTRWTEENIRKNHPATPILTEVCMDNVQTIFLNAVQFNPELYRPIETGTYIDVFGSRKKGIMPGTLTMVTGDPGIGKSSVMMDILQGIKSVNDARRVLFICAEMTLVDMLDPDEFMKYYPGLHGKVEFLFAGDYLDNDDGPTFSQAMEIILLRGYDVVVLDSLVEVQHIVQSEVGLGSGKSAEKYMLNLMQKHVQAQNDLQKHTAFLLIQQVKKDGEFVGSRRLEHMITAFLSIKWDAEHRGKKYMEFRKNRRGDVKLRLYFKFGSTGIEYDSKKYESELQVGQILSSDANILQELDDLELRNLLSNTSAEEDQLD